jgi:Ca-activated chloride channel family protein
VAIRGSIYGQDREYTVKADFPAAEDRGNQFVAPIWAARKIGFYLQEIRLHGPSDELIQEVTRLSKEYGIITEYTSYLADAGPQPTSAPDMLRETRGRMERANAEQSGGWAFNQAVNDKEMQSRVVASKAANSFRDRSGIRKDAENIAQIEGQAFYARDGKWEDAEEKGDRKVRKVRQFSKEYFDLIGKDEKFKRAQTLNGAISVNVGEERIEVEK